MSDDTYPGIVLGDAPTVYWRLGEASSSAPAVDETGNGHHGNYEGGLGFGRGGAIRSDDSTCPGFGVGGNGHVSVPTPVAAKTDVTLEAWAHIRSTSRKGCILKNGSHQGTGTTTGNGYGVGVGATTWENLGDKLILLYENKRWINTGVAFRSGTGPEGWNHVVVVFDSSGFPHCYLNADLVAEPAFNDQFTAAGNLWCGGYNVGARLFNGEIDEPALYAGQLSAAQIAQHYEAGMAEWSIGALRGREAV